MNKAQSQTGENFKITGNWDFQAKQLKEKFTQLTDADLKFKSGKEDELLRRLENKLNKEREEVISFIKSGKKEKIYVEIF